MYNLELDKEQADILIRALDLYSRILSGQIDSVLSALQHEMRFTKQVNNDKIRNLCEQIKVEAFPELGSTYYAISGACESARIAYDIQQVVRYVKAWAEHPEGGHTVDFGEPLFTSRHIPKCTREENKDCDICLYKRTSDMSEPCNGCWESSHWVAEKDTPIKCGTFSSEPIPELIRERMRADRAEAELDKLRKEKR